MKYLFDHWKEVRRRLDDKKLFIFLDYDGTLTPIVKTPRQAILASGARTVLRRLEKNPRYALAVISGRSLADLKKRVGLKGIIYAGNHGLEVEGPFIRVVRLLPPLTRRMLSQILMRLKKRLAWYKGVLIEDKGLGLSVHYRMVSPRHVAAVKAVVEETMRPYLAGRKVCLSAGKKVVEVRPPVLWNKGRIVLWILAHKQLFLCRGTFLPVYIGDDKTDEDAFRMLGSRGLTVFVGEPCRSRAQYYVRNISEVLKFLRYLS